MATSHTPLALLLTFCCLTLLPVVVFGWRYSGWLAHRSSSELDWSSQKFKPNVDSVRQFKKGPLQSALDRARKNPEDSQLASLLQRENVKTVMKTIKKPLPARENGEEFIRDEQESFSSVTRLPTNKVHHHSEEFAPFLENREESKNNIQDFLKSVPSYTHPFRNPSKIDLPKQTVMENESSFMVDLDYGNEVDNFLPVKRNPNESIVKSTSYLMKLKEKYLATSTEKSITKLNVFPTHTPLMKNKIKDVEAQQNPSLSSIIDGSDAVANNAAKSDLGENFSGEVLENENISESINLKQQSVVTNLYEEMDFDDVEEVSKTPPLDHYPSENNWLMSDFANEVYKHTFTTPSDTHEFDELSNFAHGNSQAFTVKPTTPNTNENEPPPEWIPFKHVMDNKHFYLRNTTVYRKPPGISFLDLEMKNSLRNSVSPIQNPVRSPEYDKECLDPNMKFGCASCGAYVTCVEHKAYVTKCDFPQETCHRDTFFSGGVCKLEPSPGCSCEGYNSMKPDPFDPGSYLTCDSDEPELVSCGANKEFKELEQKCETRIAAPFCENPGTFANVNDCRWFYTCMYPTRSSSSYHQVFQRCDDPNEVFSSASQTCVKKDTLTFSDQCLRSGLNLLPGSLTGQISSIVSSIINSQTSAATTTTTTTTASTPTTAAPSTEIQVKKLYTCPLIVLLIVFWWPNVVNWLCWF